MTFICTRIYNYFYITSFPVSLALRQRLGETRKWPISQCHSYSDCSYDFPGGGGRASGGGCKGGGGPFCGGFLSSSPALSASFVRRFCRHSCRVTTFLCAVTLFSQRFADPRLVSFMCTGKAWKKLLVYEGKQCNHFRSNDSKIPYISVLGKNNLKEF